MHVHDAIRSRRTVYDFTDDPVDRSALERVLTYGVWAPNHHRTEPWRFTIVGPRTKEALAEVFAEGRAQRLPADASPERREERRAGARQRFLAKPAVVIATQVLADDEGTRREDYAAVCCAIHNVTLAAWADGLGAQWSTNPVLSGYEGCSALGIDPDREAIVGILYFGRPAVVPDVNRRPLAEVLRTTP